jgi:hypothetical protein
MGAVRLRVRSTATRPAEPALAQRKPLGKNSVLVGQLRDNYRVLVASLHRAADPQVEREPHKGGR